MSTDKSWSYFYEIYEAIPRQAPGDRLSTERALRMLPTLDSNRRILDIGCGKGIADLGLGARVTAQVGDMNDLQFSDGSLRQTDIDYSVNSSCRRYAGGKTTTCHSLSVWNAFGRDMPATPMR